MANAKRMIGALNVTVIYRVDGEVRTFRESVVAPIAIERYLQLECGDPVGLFVPVGNGQQVNALNIEWFEIDRVRSEEAIHVGPIHYDIDIDVAGLLKKRIGDERRE